MMIELRTFLFTTAFFLTVLASVSSFAENSGDSATTERLVKVRLLPEKNTIEAGETIWIGVEQSIHPGWHTYWKNPGDSGSAPRVDWGLPEGFLISDIHWPAAKKLPYGPLLNYGYEGNVVLLQKLTAPPALPSGAITLTADYELLVCKEECIPEFGTYELVLNKPGTSLENNSPYLEAALGKLPEDADWQASFYEEGNDFVVKISLPERAYFLNTDSVSFLPADWGVVDNAAKPEITLKGSDLVIRQSRGDRPLKELDMITGVLTLTNNSEIDRAFAFTAEKKTPLIVNLKRAGVEQTTGGFNPALFAQAIIFALLGGVILNLMPCVFPVLSIKALSLIKVADKDPGKARILGLSYTAGVVLSFLLIAGLLIIFKAGGDQIGWGFQLQDPFAVTLLAYLLFIIGLNLSGFFEVNVQLGNIGQRLTQGNGVTSSFATGVLATLVATPCTAPFMASAIGFALVQSAFVALSVFAALGFGLALPYLLLSFIPALQKKLPRPGSWMEIFRQFLAFPMYISAAWLAWVVAQQAGHIGLFGLLLGCVSIVFAIWLIKIRPEGGKLRSVLLVTSVIFFLLALGFLPAGGKMVHEKRQDGGPDSAAQEEKFGEVFSPALLEEALKADHPVFVEMTAAWCITCKVNHAVAINIQSTKKLFKDHSVQFLIGDWTNRNPEITAYLDSYGRNGVPIYVFYGPRDPETGLRPEPRVLPQILTPGIIEETITSSPTKET